jgi:hypothetical protein
MVARSRRSGPQVHEMLQAELPLSPARVQFDTCLCDYDSYMAVLDSEPHGCWRGQDSRNGRCSPPKSSVSRDRVSRGADW